MRRSPSENPVEIPDTPRFDRRDLLENDMSSGRFELTRYIALDVMHKLQRNLPARYIPGDLADGIFTREREHISFARLCKIFNLPADATEIDLIQSAGTFLYGNVNTNHKTSALVQVELRRDLDEACNWLAQERDNPTHPRSITSLSRKQSGNPRTFQTLPVNLGTALVLSGERDSTITPVSIAGLVKILGAEEVSRIFVKNGLPIPLAAQNENAADDTIDTTRTALGGKVDDAIDAEFFEE